MHRGWSRESSPGIQCGNGKKRGPCHRNVKYCNRTVQGVRKLCTIGDIGHSCSGVKDPLQIRFLKLLPLATKTWSGLENRMQTYPTRFFLTREEAISKNLAFSLVHPELKQSKYRQKCAHHAPAKTFYRAPRWTAGFSVNKNLLFSFFPHQKSCSATLKP